MSGVEALHFDEAYVGPVLNDEKTATVRYDIDLPEVGDYLSATFDDGTEFAILEVQRTASVLAVEVPDLLELFGAEYGSETVDELLDGLNRHYEAGIQPGTNVEIIVFEEVSI